MNFSYEHKVKLRGLFPGKKYARQWKRERLIEKAVLRQLQLDRQSDEFWHWLWAQTLGKEMTWHA